MFSCIPKLNLTTIAHATMLASSLLLGGLSAAPASAAAPMAKFAAPGFFRLMLGDFEVTALSDGTVDTPAAKLLHQNPAKTEAALARAFLTSPMETSVNAYLINTGSKLVLIDTGAGALFGPTLGKLQDSLRAAGYTSDQVDEVLLTHLHPDHVGGLVQNSKSAFPNAIVRSDQRDGDYWLSKSNLDQAPADAKGFFQGAMGSLEPYVTAHTYQPFSGDAELLPGIRAVSSVGHTVGHVSYLVESQHSKLLIVGDLIHIPAVQLEHPEVTIDYDTDGKMASRSRAHWFTEAAKTGALVAASHMPFPGIGHLQAAGQGYRWIPVNYTRSR